MKGPFCNCKKAPLFCKKKNKRIKKVKKRKKAKKITLLCGTTCLGVVICSSFRGFALRDKPVLLARYSLQEGIISAEINNCMHWQQMSFN